jgi:uncharacterized membrane protein
MAYHFGVPGYAVWTSHILIGLYLVYVGWVLYDKKRLDKSAPIVLIVLGVLAALYHGHIWYTHLVEDKPKNKQKKR